MRLRHAERHSNEVQVLIETMTTNDKLKPALVAVHTLIYHHRHCFVRAEENRCENR